MKHIVLVTPTLGGGGAERTTLLIANGLADLGYRVTLAVADTRREKGALKSELSSAVDLLDFDCARMINFLIPFSKWLKESQPQIIISSQTHTNLIVYLSAQLAFYNGKLIAREVSTPSVNLKHLRGIKKWLTQSMMRFVYSRVNSLVPVSYGVADDLRTYLKTSFTQVSIIYDPVITTDLFDKGRLPLEHPWFAADREIPVILAAGRLTEAKNYQMLIKAFAQLIEKTPAHLLVLGEGEDRSDLERLINILNLDSVVSLPGFDRNPFRYMAHCDLYVMSSKWEGLPGALIQALALGARIVSTDCPSGPREILMNGQYGTLVKVDSVEDLASAMEEQLRAERKIINRADIGRDFKLDKVLQQYIDLID